MNNCSIMTSRTKSLKTLQVLSEVKLGDCFENGFLQAVQTLEADNFGNLLTTSSHYLSSVYVCLSFDVSCSTWKYICFSLECLLRLKDDLQNQNEESEKLLSVSQQRLIRGILDQVISLGLVPNLLPGVAPPTQTKISSLESSFSDIQKYECLCLVTLALIELYHDDTFHGIVLPQFLSPILHSLCQLTMVPLKKSADTYPRLHRERIVFQRHLDQLLSELYQPMVVKGLMVIEGNKHNPKWLKRGVGKILTAQLHRQRGVFSIVQAVRDAANCSAPTSHAHMESIAQVITASPDLANISPQILELLDSNDSELVRVAVLCLRTLHARDSSTYDHLLLQHITEPLMSKHASSEQQISQCLDRLQKCFTIPASDLWCLSPLLLKPYIHILFRLYCKVYQSASNSRKAAEDLIWRFLSKCEDIILKDVFRCFVYKEQVSGVIIKNSIDFVFGDDGGVKLVLEENEQSLEEFGDCLMVLLERRDTDGLLGNKLFITLLEESAGEEKELGTIDGLEKRLVTVKLLAVLSENPAVHKSLSNNPEPVVRFLRSMIEKFLKDVSKQVDLISIALVVLNVILNDFIYCKKSNWDAFTQLEEPLSRLKCTTESAELRLLAEEAYEVIKTHGAVEVHKHHVVDKNCCKATSTWRDSECDEALREACDPLLPVRGHAIMQLGKLLAAGDKRARAKKDQILCIFQESIKDEDSFLYLSAIEALAVAAAEFPDNVIVSLTEQFTRQSLRSDTRLKVGEALVRVTKLLGDLVPVYKAELINAFLWATRDDDFLVRASSLSNLGELCRVLGFRVGPIVAEVLVCARCIVSSDPSVEVRRAAVMLISLLLKGLHKDTFTVLQEVLVEIYRSLKHIYSSDKDDVTRLHAQLALEELNCGTLAFLFPKPQLTKQIFVLDPPS